MTMPFRRNTQTLFIDVMLLLGTFKFKEIDKFFIQVDSIFSLSSRKNSAYFIILLNESRLANLVS